MTLRAAIAGLVFASALSAVGCAPAAVAPDRHVVPNGLSQVALEKFDVVSFLDVDLFTAVQTRDAVDSEYRRHSARAGHPRWFFHAFDRSNLDFVVARFDVADATRPRYVAERRLRVKRTLEAERQLGVAEVVRDYEHGFRGVTLGMSRAEVTRTVGAPRSIVRSRGGIDLVYTSFCVRLVEEEVAYMWRCDGT